MRNLTFILSIFTILGFCFLQSCSTCEDDTCYECLNPDKPDCRIVICDEKVAQSPGCNSGTTINYGQSGSCNDDLKKIQEANGFECKKK